MALRRGILTKHSTIDSLLEGKEYFIQVKPAKADEPIFLAGRVRGMTPTRTPIKTNGLGSKFEKTPRKAGYGTGVTLYAWRQRFATNVNRAVGEDRARYAMNHAPESKTMEKHYEQSNYNLLVMEIAMKEPISRAQALMEAETSAAVTRMVDQSQVIIIAEELVKKRVKSNEAYLPAIESGDRSVKNVAVAREGLQVGEVYARKQEKKDTGHFMSTISKYIHDENLSNVINLVDEIYDYRDAEEARED